AKSNLIIRQGPEQNYKPTLYVEIANAGDSEFEPILRHAIDTVAQTYPGVDFKKNAAGQWEVLIPDRYKVGHEAHFTQVTRKYLEFLAAGHLPEWEEPNMIAKYYTIMQAYKMCAGR